MKTIASALLLCSILSASLVSCSQKETATSSVQETVTEAVTETITETTAKPETEPITEEVTEPEYFSQLVYPDTMTDKEKNGTYYRGDTILDADKAYEIGEYHLPLDPTARSRVKKMIGNVREMRIYDEQLDLNFMANIVLPPDYDENKEYPVVLITDSQYWTDEVANLWKLIGDGEASPVIFATLRLDYDINGYTDARYDEFVLNQDKTLDFITNDFMQLVSLNYKTDASRSVFFGHSLGGLFAHYALCNSDKYEYQPFAKYIIASPAMWSYYYDDSENVKDDYDIEKVSDPYAYRNDFGYFDRNETMDKNVFICAGADEHYDFDDPDLPTIPEDAQTVYDRLKAHGVNAEIKLYEGMMHMSYVGDMLKEYLRQNFPPEDPTDEQSEGLVYPDTMTNKEKANTAYRDFTLIYFDKAREIGNYNFTYSINTTTYEYVKEIEDYIRELKIYDEQLDTNFLMHITLPPDYDESKEYPVLFITDSQYWFKCVPDLWKLINDGETAPVIIATLGCDYDTDGYSDIARFERFAVHQDKMLDFITNDAMQLISANYKTDASRSVFFGHSLGGLFSHYALCNSDKYEYQPFAEYIIASPAMWSYYYTGSDGFDFSSLSDNLAYRDDFGYFDRSEAMDKKVFICAGEREKYEFEAPDLPTITQDTQTLYDRLSAHGTDAELMIFEKKHHMDYVEDMLKDYIKKTFPMGNNLQEEHK